MRSTAGLNDSGFIIKKSNTYWSISLDNHQINSQNEQALALLQITHHLLLPVKIQRYEDKITFLYTLPKEYIQFSELRSFPEEDKLRAMINVGKIKELLTLPLTFSIHPENIVFDYNLSPLLAHRGVVGMMPLAVIDELLLLRQYKSLIANLFEEKATFVRLITGGLDSIKGSEFIQTIIQLESIKAVNEYLLEEHRKRAIYRREMSCQVEIKEYNKINRLLVWQPVVSIVLLVLLLYLLLFRLPFLKSLQGVEAAFLKGNYGEVIHSLATVEIKSIPFTQKYELAYSFIQESSLQADQKQKLINNLSLSSEESYLEYWIEHGRGDFDNALDIGKKLEAPNLVLYAITKKIEEVRGNSKLSGAEKEETIGKLEERYKKYEEQKNEQLSEGKEDTGILQEE